MLESLAEWMSYPLYYAFDGAAAAAAHRRQPRHHLPLRPVPDRRRQDGDAGPAERARVGQLLRQGAAAARRWPRDPRFAGNAKRSGRSATALRALIVEAFAALTRRRRWCERLEAAQIANAQVNDMHEVWAHPQLEARGRWREVGTPAGAMPALLPPGLDDGTTARH